MHEHNIIAAGSGELNTISQPTLMSILSDLCRSSMRDDRSSPFADRHYERIIRTAIRAAIVMTA